MRKLLAMAMMKMDPAWAVTQSYKSMREAKKTQR